MSTKPARSANPKTLAKRLNTALELGEKAFLMILMEEIKIQGISSIARKTGLSRFTLHRYINEEKRPLFANVIKLTAACGVSLSFVPTRNMNESEEVDDWIDRG
jgi:DNA-binding phage protein